MWTIVVTQQNLLGYSRCLSTLLMQRGSSCLEQGEIMYSSKCSRILQKLQIVHAFQNHRDAGKLLILENMEEVGIFHMFENSVDTGVF